MLAVMVAAAVCFAGSPAFAQKAKSKTSDKPPPKSGATELQKSKPNRGAPRAKSIAVNGVKRGIKPEDVKGPHPIIKADKLVHNFGETWVGPILQHTFILSNVGDALLEISKIKPG